MRNVIKNCDETEFRAIVARSNSMREIIAAFNLNVCGAQYDAVRAKMKSLGLDSTMFDATKYVKAAHAAIRIPLEEILVENSRYSSFSRLKKRLVSENVLEYACKLCGLTEWLGKPLSLQLDHINGNDRDHRKENIRLVCPNCHSQTENYAGRNKH